MATGGLVLAGALPAVLVKEPGKKDVARRVGEQKGRGGLLGGRSSQAHKGMAASRGAGWLCRGTGRRSNQRRRASCVPSLSYTQPAYPAAPQRYLKSNVVRITCISAYGAATQRGEIATPLRRRGECGAGREHSSVSGVRRWESTPVNKLARVAAPAWICLKSSYSRN